MIKAVKIAIKAVKISDEVAIKAVKINDKIAKAGGEKNQRRLCGLYFLTSRAKCRDPQIIILQTLSPLIFAA
jgi:hypothetical protein